MVYGHGYCPVSAVISACAEIVSKGRGEVEYSGVFDSREPSCNPVEWEIVLELSLMLPLLKIWLVV